MTASPLIDVHAHYTTDHYIETAKANGHARADGMPEEYWPRWNPEDHLRLMDDLGIGRSVLSMSSPGVHFGDDAVARDLARSVNEAGAAAVAGHPDRFGLFASLPLPDVEGSLAELGHAFDELGADGVVLMSNSQGVYFGDSRMDRVLAELNRRGAVVLLHPTSTACGASSGLDFPRPMIEFLFDAARTVIQYVLSGSAERYPDIRVIVPHGGGVIPLLADRVEMFRTLLGQGAGRSIHDLLRGFYFELAGTPSEARTNALETVAGPDHLLYGSDYPWTPANLAGRLLDDLDRVTGDGWRQRTTRNAERLFTRG